MMAEKPRLKKSDEILGSIAASPARASGRRGAARADASDSGQRERRRAPEPEPVEISPETEDLELNDQPVLPSAQSLAEKIMARDDKRKQLNFDKYELPKRTVAGPPQGPEAAQTPPPQAAEPRRGPEPAQTPPPQAAEPRRGPEPAQPPTRAAEPRRGPESAQTPPPQAAEPRRGPAPAQPPTRAAKRASEPDQEPPPRAITFEQGSRAAPIITEYTFQSFEEPEQTPVREFSVERDGAPAGGQGRAPRERPRRSRILNNNIQDEPDTGFDTHFDFEPAPPARPEPEPEPEPSREPEPRRSQIPEPEPEPSREPEPRRSQIPEPEPEPRNARYPEREPEVRTQATAPPKAEEDPEAQAERRRQEFLNRISDQFKLQFEEKFEEGTLKPRGSGRGSARAEPPVKPTGARFGSDPRSAMRLGSEPESGSSPEPAEEEDFLTYVQRQEREHGRQAGVGPGPAPSAPQRTEDGDEAPALEFIEKFRRDVREEEERRSEDFKETLAEKFERERERYLKELEMSQIEPEEDPPVEAPVQSARRRLDFQIQPEMHMRDGETPPAPKPATGPVTYTRGGTARPQVHEDRGAAGGTPAQASSQPGVKKTGEQLLMEHTARARTQAPRQKPANLKFTFSTPEEQDKEVKKEKPPILPAEKWPRRIVITAMFASLFAIGLLVWPLVSQMRLAERIRQQSEAPGAESLPVSEDTLNVYNDLSYTQTAKVNNVVFKNAGVTLRNVDVAEYVIIDEIEQSGRIRLEDMSVNTAVSVKSCGIDTLELHNVRTDRVIINNAKADMTITASGSTDVGVIELRTPASVRLSEPSGDSGGIRGMVITPAESGDSINATLGGLALQTLDASASESILTFEDGARAESMSSDGSLSLSGSGKVMNLSIGAKTGLGAGDSEDRKDVTLFVKGVAVTNLNVRSAANLNISTTVDNLSTSEPVFVGGDGNIGAMSLNPRIDAGRLLVDIVGTNIQSLYSNTPSRINITGSAHVNTLTADASTYALGSKVNHLIVKSDGVIYENEPDKTTVSDGIRPPQTKAENPNLDYNLGSPATPDVAEGDFATTCAHSRENGGFLLGDGSADSPYEVSTPSQLAHISSHLDSHFVQTADIDISNDSRFSGSFAMIGSAGSPFAGVYDGGGYSISNLRIISSDENVGLFAANTGIIRNVRLVSGEVSSGATGLSFIGGIVGLNSDGGSVRSCSNGANVNGNQNTYTGGIAGYNFGGKVHDCYNYARVSGVDIVGGLVGFNRRSATLTGSYNVGVVEGRNDVGSVAGMNDDATIANCYYLADTADTGIGSGDGTAVERDSSELASPQMAADLAAGNESSLWVAGGSGNGSYKYPTLRNP